MIGVKCLRLTLAKPRVPNRLGLVFWPSCLLYRRVLLYVSCTTRGCPCRHRNSLYFRCGMGNAGAG
jgi:hypothetical protein